MPGNIIDLDVMARIAQQGAEAMVRQEFGDDGVVQLVALIKAVRSLYRYVSPESLSGPLIVFQPVGDWQAPPGREPVRSVPTLSSLGQPPKGGFVCRICGNGRTDVWLDPPTTVDELSDGCVVYQLSQDGETIHARRRAEAVANPMPCYRSGLSLPTFASLDAALEAYRVRMVRNSTCYLLSEAWYDERRLFLRNGQEYRMRRSLTQFLRSTLADAEVRPEQVVDETHPVDIKVTWELTNRRAIIEMKWLGTSRAADGSIKDKHRSARANQGARQLADYLDANKTHSPCQHTHGYLVVIDARRRRLTEQSVSIGAGDGMYYADVEITYDPPYHEARGDFAAPCRMFAEPICD